MLEALTGMGVDVQLVLEALTGATGIEDVQDVLAALTGTTDFERVVQVVVVCGILTGATGVDSTGAMVGIGIMPGMVDEARSGDTMVDELQSLSSLGAPPAYAAEAAANSEMAVKILMVSFRQKEK